LWQWRVTVTTPQLVICGLGSRACTRPPTLPPTSQLKDLYKIFLEEKMERLGEFSAALDQDAKDLQVILGLTTRDAQVR